jgi:hypothetical protein
MAVRESVHNKKARIAVRNFIKKSKEERTIEFDPLGVPTGVKHECFSGRTLVCGEGDFGVYRPFMEEDTSNCKGGHVERC